MKNEDELQHPFEDSQILLLFSESGWEMGNEFQRVTLKVRESEN